MNGQNIPDYNLVHAKLAAEYVSNKKAKVLVVGCNTGADCKNIIDLGFPEVWGVDVVDEIGRDFPHPKVRYLKTSVEELNIPDNTFDLIFSFATMEHVPDIQKGFLEMARVTKPGGWIYSVAAPLWNSPQGHHKPDLFSEHPWVHLLHNKTEIIELCKKEGIVSPDEKDIEFHIDYMLNPKFFNMTPARFYKIVCSELVEFKTLRNDFDCLPDSFLIPGSDLEHKLSSKGYSRLELLAVTHVYIGQKLDPNRSKFYDRLQRFWRW